MSDGMDQDLIAERLQERDVLGIVSAAMAKRRKYQPRLSQKVSALENMASPEVRAAVVRVVDEHLKAEVERIVEARLQQSAGEIALLNRPKGAPLKLILVAVAAVTGVSVGDLTGPCRMRSLAWPRHLAFHVVKRARPDLSLPSIGRAFGGRDHTTIMHGLRKVAAMADQQPFDAWLAHPTLVELMKQGSEP